MTIIKDDDLDISFLDLYNSYLELYNIFSPKPSDVKVTHYKFVKEALYREYPVAPGLYGKIKVSETNPFDIIEMV